MILSILKSFLSSSLVATFMVILAFLMVAGCISLATIMLLVHLPGFLYNTLESPLESQ